MTSPLGRAERHLPGRIPGPEHYLQRRYRPHGPCRPHAAGASTGLLVFDTVVLDPPGSPPVFYTLHTAPRDIGRIARAAGARKLLLSQLTPSIDQARELVPRSIHESYKGPIEFARDDSSLDLP